MTMGNYRKLWEQENTVCVVDVIEKTPKKEHHEEKEH